MQQQLIFAGQFYLMTLAGKKILLGITGSIAAYKSILLLRLLQNAGAEVQVIITPAAKDFVTPLTLATLSNKPVLHEVSDGESWANHVMLGRWADLFIIAPASCNTIAKMAHGITDNLLLAVYMSATCPVWVVPAMDEDMWKHTATQKNLQQLKNYGVTVFEVENGFLASGLTGPGRMQEPETILTQVEQFFKKHLPLSGKKIMVTAGPTYEAIDPVRFIGNHSSGKMGVAIADALYSLGAEVYLITGPTALNLKQKAYTVIKVTSADDMLNACILQFPGCDAAFMAAAVADYKPATKADKKIKKADGGLQNILLTENVDILKTLGSKKTDRQLLIGFALETNNAIENAQKKLEGKNADFIVLNSLGDAGAGFATDTNKITILGKNGVVQAYELKLKEAAAKDIVEFVFAL